MDACVQASHSYIHTYVYPSAVHAQFEAMHVLVYNYIYLCITSCIKLFNLMNAKSMRGGAMEFVQIWTS